MNTLKDKNVYKICYCILAALLLSVILQKTYVTIAYDTPKELREMNTVAFAYQFAHGNNLYAPSTLERTTPPLATSMYGLLVPLIMSPFVRLLSFTPLNALQICELLTLIVEVIGAVSFYRLVRRKTESPLLSIAGTLLFYSCYWRYSVNGGAFPDQWGVSLSIILADMLHSDGQRQHFRPVLYGICITALFYIKQYFVLCIIGLCIYLLISSRKDLIRFILYGFVMGCISVVLVYILFPMYFSKTFPIAQGQTLTGDFSYSYMQIYRLSVYYGPVVLFAITGILITLYRMIRHKRLQHLVTYEMCQIIFILPFLLRIAENQGTNYTYYLQLWWPYIILCGITSTALIRTSVNEYSAKIQKKNPYMICSALIFTLTAMSILKIYPSYRCDFMTDEQQEAWDTAYHMLDQYSADGDILVSMVLSGYCLENQIDTSNYGQAEFNNTHNLENYKGNKLWRNIPFFRYTEPLLQKNISYNETVKERMYHKDYSCIALVYPGEYHLTESDLVNAGYYPALALELMTGSQSWYTVFYTPTD